MKNNDIQNISIRHREDILKKMDKDNDLRLSNSDLLFSGLVLSMDYNKKDVLTIIQDLSNKKNMFEHLYEQKYMMPDQIKSYKFLEDFTKKNKILLAQTSFGKTMLVKEMIFRNSSRYQKIAFILPTNALSFEVSRDLNSSKFVKELGYVIYDTSFNEFESGEKIIFVGTQEKLFGSKALEKNSTNFDLVVIDEAYKLNDINSTRGFILNDILIDYINNPATDIILLSPVCKLNFDSIEINNDSKFHIHQNNFNPVATEYEKVKKIDSKLISEKSKDKTIIYSDSPSRVRELVKKVPEGLVENNAFPNVVLKYLEDTYTKAWPVVDAFSKGILVHNGIIPKFLQEYSINLFNNDNSNNLLFATQSIAEGVNTKTRNIIIDITSNMIEKKDNLSLFADKMLTKNLIGRAGRLNVHHVGWIFGLMEKTEFDESYLNNIPEIAFATEEEHNGNKPSKSTKLMDELTSETEIDTSNLAQEIESLGLNKSYFERMRKALRSDFESGDFKKILDIKKIIEGKPTNNQQHYSEKKTLGYVMGLSDINDRKYEFIPLKKRVHFYLDNYNDDNYLTTFMKLKNNIIPYDLILISEKGLKMIETKMIKPGENVQHILENFRRLFNLMILGRDQNENRSEIDDLVIKRLFDFGVDVSSKEIPLKSIKLISDNLNKRFSIFDIRRIITRLSENDNHLKKIKDIYFYFDNPTNDIS